MSEKVTYIGECGHTNSIEFDERKIWNEKRRGCDECGKTVDFVKEDEVSDNDMITHSQDSDAKPNSTEQNDDTDSNNESDTQQPADDDSELLSAEESLDENPSADELASAGEKIEQSADDELDEMLEAFDDDGQPIEDHEYWDDHEMPEPNKEPQHDVNEVAERGYGYLEDQPDPAEEYDIDPDDIETIGDDELRKTVLPEDYRELQNVAQAFDIQANQKAETLRDELTDEDTDEVVWTVVGLQVAPDQESDDE